MIHIDAEFTEYTETGRERIASRQRLFESLSFQDREWYRDHLKGYMAKILEQVDACYEGSTCVNPELKAILDHHLGVVAMDMTLLP